jgi:hypothetical protein
MIKTPGLICADFSFIGQLLEQFLQQTDCPDILADYVRALRFNCFHGNTC